jgi:hypothetical protein
MKAKATSFAQKRQTSLRGLKHYRITFPPPGCREVDACLEFQLLSTAPWIPEKYDLDREEYDLLDHKGLYQGLNLKVVQSYSERFNKKLNEGSGDEAFFATQEPVFEGLIQCHREAIGFWKAYEDLCLNSFRTLHQDCDKNCQTIQDLLVRLEARKTEIVNLQRCMARIAGKRTDPIINILKASGEEPAVVFGSSLVDTKRDLGSLENHCRLQQIAIADARLLLRLVERGLTLDNDGRSADFSGG